MISERSKDVLKNISVGLTSSSLFLFGALSVALIVYMLGTLFAPLIRDHLGYSGPISIFEYLGIGAMILFIFGGIISFLADCYKSGKETRDNYGWGSKDD